MCKRLARESDSLALRSTVAGHDGNDAAAVAAAAARDSNAKAVADCARLAGEGWDLGR